MITAKVISDNHFFHENIIRYCNRPFQNGDDMTSQMIRMWNESVQPDDIVIHLGDFVCGGSFFRLKNVVDQLNGYKILVTGNHDGHSVTRFQRAGFDRVFKHRWSIGMYTFSHRYQPKEYLDEVGSRYNLHGHTHKHQYGDPYFTFCVDVIGYNPVPVKLNLTEEELKTGIGISAPEKFGRDINTPDI